MKKCGTAGEGAARCGQVSNGQQRHGRARYAMGFINPEKAVLLACAAACLIAMSLPAVPEQAPQIRAVEVNPYRISETFSDCVEVLRTCRARKRMARLGL